MSHLSTAQLAAQGKLSPPEIKLHFLVQEINQRRSSLDLKEASVLRKNIRPHEVTLLNRDINELTEQIEALEGQADEMRNLIHFREDEHAA